MTHVLVQHKVKGYAAWKDRFDKFADVRRSFGEKSYHIFHPSDDPNDVILLFEWNDPKKAHDFFGSPDLKSAMQEAGVISEPSIQYLDENAKGAL